MALTQTQVAWELGGSEGRFARGAYLTNGRDLFRVASRVIIDRQSFIELEDCVSLTTVLVAQSELAPLRAVSRLPSAVG